jgi:hypothetical protein
MEEVYAGDGLRLLTSDPVVIVLARRCRELSEALREQRQLEVARFRTLRADVRQIKRRLIASKEG